MGTNFYFFSKNKTAVRKYFGETYKLVDVPDFGYEIHIAKTSCGWLPLFQAHEHSRSVRDLSNAYSSGEFRIFDEYGEGYTWEKFTERVLLHNGGIDGAVPKKPYKSEPKSPYYDGNMPDQIPVSHFEYGKGKFADMFFKDEQGYEFSEGDFA